MSNSSSAKHNNLLGLIFVGCLFAVVITGLGVWWIYDSISSHTGTSESLTIIPLELREPRVLQGESFLTRSQFYRREKLSFFQTVFGSFTFLDKRDSDKFINRQSAIGIFNFDDLKVGEYDGLDGLDVVSTNPREALFFDRQGNLKKDVGFDFPSKKVKSSWLPVELTADSVGKIQIVDIENDGVAEFFGRGDWDGSALFGNKGDLVWRFGNVEPEKLETFDVSNDPYIEDSTIADLNNDGKAEIIVGRDNDGLRAFDLATNKEIWRQEKSSVGEILDFFDADGDGKKELVEFRDVYEKEAFLLTDSTGKSFKEIKAPSEINNISFLKSADNQMTQAMCVEDGKVILVNSIGNTATELDAPLSKVARPVQNPSKIHLSTFPVRDEKNGIVAMPVEESSTLNKTESVYESKGIWAYLKTNEPKFLAVVGRFISINRSVLYVYSADGKLIYHEILPEDAETIAVLPSEKVGEPEEILVGGNQTIWRYIAK